MTVPEHPRDAEGRRMRELEEMAKKEAKETATLQDVYTVIDKWWDLPDKTIIDLFLATVLSNEEKGTPIWIIIVGPSSGFKSELIFSIEGIKGVKILDQITKNTLASGMKEKDLGYELNNKSTILAIPDLACLVSLHKDEKKIIFSQFRNLFDGRIYKRTGSGVERKYENCHVTMISGSTPNFKNEYLIFQQVGSRELLWLFKHNPDTKGEMNQAWSNREHEKQMRRELRDVIRKFLNGKIIESEEVITFTGKEFIFRQVKRLTLLRASGTYDRNNELTSVVYPERPGRLVKQFKLLWRCLKSLDDDYSDDRCKKIIEHLVDSSGDDVRQHIMTHFIKSHGRPVNTYDLKEKFKLAYSKIKRELELLTNVGWLNSVIREERIGGVVKGIGSEERHYGGRWERVTHYSRSSPKEESTNLFKFGYDKNQKESG